MNHKIIEFPKGKKVRFQLDPLSRCLCAVSLLLVGFLIGLHLERQFDPFYILPSPDNCVLCQAEAYDAPCLLNVSTGELGELSGTLVPGKWTPLVCAGLVGFWDSDAQTAHFTLPTLEASISLKHFCRPCRDALENTVPGAYAVVDFSEPNAPRVYPAVAGVTYECLGKTVQIREEAEGLFTLELFPAPPEAAFLSE